MLPISQLQVTQDVACQPGKTLCCLSVGFAQALGTASGLSRRGLGYHHSVSESDADTWTRRSRRPTGSDSEYRLEVDFKALRRNTPSRSLSGTDSEATAESDGGATYQGSDCTGDSDVLSKLAKA